MYAFELALQDERPARADFAQRRERLYPARQSELKQL
jgi:hypothetical protein